MRSKPANPTAPSDSHQELWIQRAKNCGLEPGTTVHANISIVGKHFGVPELSTRAWRSQYELEPPRPDEMSTDAYDNKVRVSYKSEVTKRYLEFERSNFSRSINLSDPHSSVWKEQALLLQSKLSALGK